MSYTRAEFIADQLVASNPDAEWDAAGVDRAIELARIFERAGIVDLSRLYLVPVTVQTREYAWSEPVESNSYAFLYEGKHFGFLGGPHEPENRETLHLTSKGYEVAWSAEGDGHVGFVVVPLESGFGFAPIWGSSSDMGTFRQLVAGAVFVLSFAFPAAGISVGNAIGAAVVPATTAAAYPGLTTLVGNVALGAAFSGGNIEQALETAIAGYIGGVAGAQVQAATNVKGLAVVAAAATRAYIQGGNVEGAVRSALLSQGVNIVNDFFTSTAPAIYDWGTGSGYASDLTGDPLAQFNPEFQFTTDYGNFWDLDAGDVWGLWPDLTPDFGVQPDGSWLAEPIPIPDVPGYPITNPTGPAAQDWTYQDILKAASATIQVALQAVAATKQIQAITVNQRAQSVNGQTVTRATDDGRIATRHPDGTVTYSLPPVNSAQATITGNYIVNNGDGTYTLVSANGQRTTRSYSASGGSGSLFGGMSTGMMIALGAGALLLLGKGK